MQGPRNGAFEAEAVFPGFASLRRRGKGQALYIATWLFPPREEEAALGHMAEIA